MKKSLIRLAASVVLSVALVAVSVVFSLRLVKQQGIRTRIPSRTGARK